MAKETTDEPTTTFPARTRAVAGRYRKDDGVLVADVVVTTAEVAVTTRPASFDSPVERLGGRRARLVGERGERMVGTGAISIG
jgi:hypothetical protein